MDLCHLGQDPLDLLDAEQRERLREDLEELAAVRRRAHGAAGSLPLH